MASFIYIDNSNIFIEAMHVSAVAKGLAPNIWDAQEHKISDRDYQLDYGKLYEFLMGTRTQTKDGCAKLFGSRPPPNDSLWALCKKIGYDPIIFDRSEWTGKEKMVDAAIVTHMMKDAYSGSMDKQKDDIVLVAGDSDFTPTVEQLVKDGYTVEVVFWDHAAAVLKKTATKFTSLNGFLGNLQRQRR